MKIVSIARLAVSLGLPLAFGACACAQQYEPTLLEFLQNDGRFTTFLHLAKVTGTDSYLKTYSITGCTVVAPTNDAFSHLPAAVMTALGRNHAELAKVIEYHIVPKDDSAFDIRMGPKTVEGDLLNLTGGVPKRTARIISPDIETDNGKVQIVDQVLFPPEVFQELQRDGVVPIATGLPLHSHMTSGGVNQRVPAGTYAAARKRKKAHWNRVHRLS